MATATTNAIHNQRHHPITIADQSERTNDAAKFARQSVRKEANLSKSVSGENAAAIS